MAMRAPRRNIRSRVLELSLGSLLRLVMEPMEPFEEVERCLVLDFLLLLVAVEDLLSLSWRISGRSSMMVVWEAVYWFWMNIKE